ncbi:MAG TPA: sigma-54 dependent transcriptional regulator [Vicinamibacteria bacterium]|nr:sigma-54 dependent transcriptional regulator [Vicinamibacteria bacterium]
MNESILVVDDEEVMRDVLGTVLGGAGYRVTLARDGAEGLQLARKQAFDAAIVDVMLPEVGGLEVLEELKRLDADLVVIMITAFASVETALAAMKKGAFDYITKPFKHDEVLHILNNGLEQRRLQIENRDLRRALRDQARFAEIVGKSPRMQQVFGLISQAAPSRSTILVVGESGTGKELVAKAVHSNSPRADKPFIVVNSGSLPHDLLESNLFGHVKGAFTGAVYSKKGLFELADKGTLFFDEIGNIPLETQAKLLRVMQEREFMRLGGVETIKVDVRIVAATNIDLRRAVDEGRFREDLYYRLNVITVQLPPLRQRKEDIPALVQHFVDKYARENEKTVQAVTPDALQALMDYDWPGNVRELENVIERGVVLTTADAITRELIPDHVRTAPNFHVPHLSVPPEGISLRDVIANFERRLIESTLETTNGVQKEAARLLGLKPTTLNEMIKRHNILLPRDRERDRRPGKEIDEQSEKPTPA